MCGVPTYIASIKVNTISNAKQACNTTLPTADRSVREITFVADLEN